MTRLLQKKNLMNLAFLAAALHAVLGTLTTLFSHPALLIVDKALLGVLAVAAVVYAALREKPPRADMAQVLLILSLVWYLFSCLSMTVKYHNDWVSYNAEPLLNTAVSLLVIFPLGCAVSREGWSKFGKLLILAILLLWSAFMLFVLVRVFRGQAISLSDGGGILMYKNSLCLNCNRNTTGAIELVFFMGCCWAACRVRGVAWKALFILAAILHYAGLVLSNSRTAVYAALPALAGTVGVMVYPVLKTGKRAVRLTVSLAAAAAAAAAYYFLRDQVFALYHACVRSAAAAQAQPVPAAAADQARDILSTDITSFSGRLPIWKAVLEGLVTSFRTFCFGVTPPSVPSMIDQMRGTSKNWYSHNQFLEIAASTGVPGLCLFLSWLALMGRDAVRLVFRQKERSALLLVPVMILALLLANLTEATLMYYVFLEGYCFFFLCGVLHGAAGKGLEKKKVSRQARRNKDRKKKRSVLRTV